MKKKLRVIAALLCAALIFADMGSFTASALSFVPTAVDADGERSEVKLYSDCVYMVNMDSGEVVVDINSEKEVPPASLTKLMTAVVLLDELGGDESTLRNKMMSAGTEAFDELYDTGAATADIQPNESVSAYDLLAALLIPSAKASWFSLPMSFNIESQESSRLEIIPVRDADCFSIRL